MYKFKIIINSCGEIIKQLFEQMKTGIHTYIEEKNKKALEEQRIQIEHCIRYIETTCSKEFVDVLKDMPAEYNIKVSLSPVSIPVKFLGNNIYEVRIPKADFSKRLRPAQMIALRNELKGRIEFLNSEAEGMLEEFLRQNETEYNLLCEKCYYSGNNREIIEFNQEFQVKKQQMYASIHFRFWFYDIKLVSDEANSLYISLQVSISIPAEWS